MFNHLVFKVYTNFFVCLLNCFREVWSSAMFLLNRNRYRPVKIFWTSWINVLIPTQPCSRCCSSESSCLLQLTGKRFCKPLEKTKLLSSGELLAVEKQLKYSYLFSNMQFSTLNSFLPKGFSLSGKTISRLPEDRGGSRNPGKKGPERLSCRRF